MSALIKEKNTYQDNTDNLIQSWLQERQQVIVLFNRLCAFKSCMHIKSQRFLIKKALDNFCSILIDYISVGQFSVFLKIVNAAECQQQTNFLVPKSLLEALKRLALVAVDFNDEYIDCVTFETLEADLSLLGQQMEQRFELEDALLNIYLQVKEASCPHLAHTNSPIPFRLYS